MPEIKDKKETAYLVFGVHVHAGNLFSAKILKIKDGKINEWKHGSPTSLGHALNIAEDLMGAYVIQAIEVGAEQFYNDVKVI